MLMKELLARKTQLEAEMESLQQKIQPLEESFKKKREMVQHVTRMIELENGTDTSESSSLIASVTPIISGGESFRSSLPDAQVVPIFVRYRGQRYDAELDRSRIIGDRGQCVRFRDKWMAPSAAGTSIPTKNLVNGWKFWKYLRSDGNVGMIDELRTFVWNPKTST